ncbi:MAG: protein kinase, partial [Candidatus Eremiobacterota bacterium]
AAAALRGRSLAGLPYVLPVGTSLRARYKISRVLDQSRLRNIYVAEDQHLRGKLWVIKQMQPVGVDASERNRLLTQFQAEAMLISSLEHPNLPKLVDFFAQDSSLFVIREYVPGADLNTIYEQRKVPLPEEDVLRIGAQLADLLNFLLKKKLAPVVMRDMSLPNLIMTPEGRVLLVDLGFSRLFQRQATAAPPDYAAPEQFTQEAAFDNRSVVYNLGALLYHLITGTNPGSSPFNLVPISHLNPRVSEATRNLIEKAVKNEPRERHATLLDFKKGMEAALARKPVVKAAVARRPSVRRTFAFSPRLKAWTLGVLLTVLMGGALVAIYHYLLRPIGGQ